MGILAEITKPVNLKGVTYENYRGIGYLMYLGFEQDEETEEWHYRGEKDQVKIEEDFGLVSNGKFNIKFGSVPITFDCTRLGLTSLQGAPTYCSNFICDYNNITVVDHLPIAENYSLKNCEIERFDADFPDEVKRLNLEGNRKLSSFDHFPKVVETLIIKSCNYSSLEDVPDVQMYLYIGYNPLQSLKGLEKLKVVHLSADGCNLKSLEYCPFVLLWGNFSNNRLENLKGIRGSFADRLTIDNNPNLKSLEGICQIFSRTLIAYDTGLETLEHINILSEIQNIELSNNKNLKSIYFEQTKPVKMGIRNCPNINMYEFFKMGLTSNSFGTVDTGYTKGQSIQINYHDTVSVNKGDVVTVLGWTEEEFYEDMFKYLTTSKSKIFTNMARVDDSKESIVKDLTEIVWYGNNDTLESVRNYVQSLKSTIKYNL
jgi:hypothetical protein